MNDDIQKQIETIVNKWSECDLSDVGKIIDLRRILSTYYYTLAEHKGSQEKGFLTWETKRKSLYYANYYENLQLGHTAAKSQAYSENTKEVIDARKSEVTYEREYKYARDILNSLDHVLNAMSSAIRLAEKEYSQGNNHV